MEEHQKSRVVVETPAGKREEVVRSQVERTPSREGISAGTVAALVIGAVALVTIFFLFLMNRQSQDDATTANVQTTTTESIPSTQQQPVVIQQQPPTTQPVIIQQPATTTPVIVPPVTPSMPASAPTSSTAGVSDDLTVQSNVDKRIQADRTLSQLGLTATVIDGKVTLIGSVNSAEVKARAERIIRDVKGVKSVDNQIIVSGSDTANVSVPY